MVELGVRCVRFGSPPDPSVPQQHFIGVSGTKFTPADAGIVYTQMIRKEKNARGLAQHLDSRLDLTRTSKCRMMVGDSMPGYTSLGSMSKRLGYKVHPNNGQVIPPEPDDTEGNGGLLPDPRSSVSNFGLSDGIAKGGRARRSSASSATTCRSSASRRSALGRTRSEHTMRRTGLQAAGSAATSSTPSRDDAVALIRRRVGEKPMHLI
uniref:Uncharacterized protein n=1 Tax=Alexandrium catenella TaxID=2925 RepID=A0A7S1QJB8_ALECA|mmetsp:Transcript_3335/g.8915  ORF Transcript_3335/g.8915 Transcript_3335/m.8915 type:complete len:208 (+) Transcript_3335:130-753(+)